MNINPFDSDPNGGNIEEFPIGKKMPEHMLCLTKKEERILSKIPQQERVNYLYHSVEPELVEAKKSLVKKLASQGGIKAENSDEIFIPRSFLESRGIVPITKNNLDELAKNE